VVRETPATLMIATRGSVSRRTNLSRGRKTGGGSQVILFGPKCFPGLFCGRFYGAFRYIFCCFMTIGFDCGIEALSSGEYAACVHGISSIIYSYYIDCSRIFC